MMNLDILSTLQNNTANMPSGKTDIKSPLVDVNTPSPADFSMLLDAQTGNKSSVDINATLAKLAQKLEAKGQAVNKATLEQATLANEQNGSLTLNNQQLKQISDAIDKLTGNNIDQTNTNDALKTVVSTDKKVAKDDTVSDSDIPPQPIQALLAMLAAQPQAVETKTFNAKQVTEVGQEQTDTAPNMLVVSGKATDVTASLLKSAEGNASNDVDNGRENSDDSAVIKDKATLIGNSLLNAQSDTDTTDTKAENIKAGLNHVLASLQSITGKTTLSGKPSITGKQSLETYQPVAAAAAVTMDSSVVSMQSVAVATTAVQPGATNTENNAGNNPLLQAINQAHNAIPAVSTPVTLSPPTQSTVINAPSVPQLNAQLGSSEWQQSLSHQVLMFNRLGQQTAELRLHPEDLGSIQISMKIQDNQAQIHFVSGHSQVRAAIESAMPELRTALADNGISLGQSSVGSDASAWQQTQQQGGQQSGAQGQGNPASWAAHADSNNLVSVSDALPVPAALHSLANGNSAIDTFA